MTTRCNTASLASPTSVRNKRTVWTSHGILHCHINRKPKRAKHNEFSRVVRCTAFSGYLGDDKSQWAQYDATALLSDYSGPKLPVLIDTGTSDNFYKARHPLFGGATKLGSCWTRGSS